MGQDKATLEVAGQRLLDRAVDALAGHACEVVLACGPEERYADRGLRLALDAGSDLGPLGGLGAGLAQARTDWVLLLACDMPAAGAALGALRAGVREGDQVVHFESGGHPEPTCALYHASTRAPIEAALAAGERKVSSFWAGLAVRALSVPDTGPFANVNTPEDLARARAARE